MAITAQKKPQAHGQEKERRQEKVKKGTRVSWTYQGKRTYGVVTSIKGRKRLQREGTIWRHRYASWL